MHLNDVLAELEHLGSPDVKAIKTRFAITAEQSHGIFLKDIKALAKRIGLTCGRIASALSNQSRQSSMTSPRVGRASMPGNSSAIGVAHSSVTTTPAIRR